MSQQSNAMFGDVDTLNPFERIRLTYRLIRDDDVPMWTKAAVPVIALLYLFLPIDLIPDVILGLGQIDDLSVLGISLFVMTRVLPKLAPKDRVNAHIAGMRGEPVERSRRDADEDVIETSYTVNDAGSRASGGR